MVPPPQKCPLPACKPVYFFSLFLDVNVTKSVQVDIDAIDPVQKQEEITPIQKEEPEKNAVVLKKVQQLRLQNSTRVCS